MMNVVIVLCVLAIIGFGLFKLLWLIDFFNMDGPKKTKKNENAEDGTISKKHELSEESNK